VSDVVNPSVSEPAEGVCVVDARDSTGA
jgi:hypothetical protein